MSIIASTARDKSPILALLRKVIIEFLFPGTTPDQREAVLAHFAWIADHKETLFVNCKFETVPELLLTRITLEASFAPLKSPVSN